ncbi:uncharacterized protein A4U43_C07F38180 [Asparagus officinalis]|uniref:Protein downstream neighbor of Son n=1 Tax=Asparagus officinalis TaxID=4686 RepID=A0A5P1EIG8_ASPOF|nr:uncharacterized protein LOC109849154 isoform X2 [Asparagus officinalis]ONK65543.1 uncharacterized protein A4U43_C07F38180 [Asparagus officinalis]
MAKAAVVESAPTRNFPFGRVRSDVKMKRKTPSELRGEQLKRRNGELQADVQLAPLLASDRINLGPTTCRQKLESKIPKYISTRVNELYPVKKSSERCKMLHGKETAKDPCTVSKISHDVIDSSVTSILPPRDESSLPCLSDKANILNDVGRPDSSAKESGEHGFRKIEKCSLSALRNVVEIHLGNEKSSDSAKVDMQTALKGLVARDIPGSSSSWADSSLKHGDLLSVSSRSFYSEFQIPGCKTPLDFTLKTTLRLVSSSSVKWCHRISAGLASVPHIHFNKEQKFGCTSGPNMSADTMYTKALTTWIYPQSSLPSSIISVMALSSVKGEKGFLSKRQQDWEDSFQNLYYMLRRNMCNIFYVYTTQFVVLFIGGNFLGKKHSCNAYLSQSTRGLRSLLKKHDIHFSMPLCCVEVEQAAADDLVELSEIEKRNLGQTIQMDSMNDVDNSPQSLLAFTGNEIVHGLYDFLLNYRFFLNSLTGVDVPVLYAPVPFQNASLSVPEVKCREMRRADAVLPCSSGSDADGSEVTIGSGSVVCYSIEIKDTIIPPWTVSGICAAMRSDGRSFESSFTTEPSSIGLNVALEFLCQGHDPSTDSSNSLPKDGDALGVPEAIPSPQLRSSSLKSLKYSNGSYVAYVTPV